MTHVVSFPGLGLEFTLDRVAFTVLGRPVYWYGVIIALGFLLAVAFCSRIAPRFGVTPDSLTDMLLFAVPLSILGARLYYILFYLDLYRDAQGKLDFAAMVRVWDGGIAIYGAVIAAVLTVAVFCRVRRVKVGAYLDVGAFGLLIGQAIGRWGNFVNVEAYGGETTLPWRMRIADAQSALSGTGWLEVHPTFLYESLWNVVGLALLLVLVNRGWRRFDGQVFLGYVLWYGAGRFWIEGLRADSLYLFGLKLFGVPIRTSQALAAVSALTALALLIYHLKIKKHSPEELFVHQIKSKEAVSHDDPGRESPGGEAEERAEE